MPDIINCKLCGAEIEVMVFDHPEDWVMMRNFNHEESGRCERGCNQVWRLYEYVECDECGEWFGVFSEYWQPCNSQGYVNVCVAMWLEDVTPELSDGWVTGRTNATPDLEHVTLSPRPI